MIYFGENDSFIFAECEDCKRELRIEKEQIEENNPFLYKIGSPLKCSCERVSDIIKKDRQATYHIRQQITGLLDLLQKKSIIENKMEEINAELNYHRKPPAYFNIILKDVLFSLKLFLIMFGIGLGLEVLLFIVSGLIFVGGLAFQNAEICLLGNELLYNLNIFKGNGEKILKSFSISSDVPVLDRSVASGKFVLDYLPHAIAGILQIVIYIGIIALVVRIAITLIRIIYYVTVVLSKKYQINQNRGEHESTLSNLSVRLQDLNEQISEYTIIPSSFKHLKEVETIHSYFLNNRVDTVREALNLYQSESFSQKILEYQKAIYSESKLTKKYTKALYILTSDETAQVEVKEEVDDLENYKMKEIIRTTMGRIKDRKKPITKSEEMANVAHRSKKSLPSQKRKTNPSYRSRIGDGSGADNKLPSRPKPKSSEESLSQNPNKAD